MRETGVHSIFLITSGKKISNTYASCFSRIALAAIASYVKHRNIKTQRITKKIPLLLEWLPFLTIDVNDILNYRTNYVLHKCCKKAFRE